MMCNSKLAVTTLLCLAASFTCQFASAQNARRAAQSARQSRERPPRAVPIQNGKLALSPENSTIQFVGTHVGERPDPRVGFFTKFSGELAFDEAAKALQGAALKIETTSLVTPIARLTGHLQSPDFFDVRQYPEATFVAKKVEVANAARGQYKITGDLTIREITRSIELPATVKVTDAGATLVSKFKIKRSDFGMTFGPDRVEDEVAMSVTVGRATPKVEPQ